MDPFLEGPEKFSHPDIEIYDYIPVQLFRYYGLTLSVLSYHKKYHF